MILDMVYEHAKQVGNASHRFRLSCSACEVGEHPDASCSDLLRGASTSRPSSHPPKGPAVLPRRDTARATLHLEGDPEIGVTMKGLEDCVEEFVSPFSAGPVKELLLSRLVDTRDATDDNSKHYLITFLLEQMKRPTFQVEILKRLPYSDLM